MVKFGYPFLLKGCQRGGSDMPEIHVTAQHTDSPFEFSEVHSMVDASAIEALQLVAVILDGLADHSGVPKDELLLLLSLVWFGLKSDIVESVDLSKAREVFEKFGGGGN